MKTFVKVAIAVLLVAGTMTACVGEKTYVCKLCEETFEGKANVAKRDGESAELCDDCYELYQLAEAFLGDEEIDE